MISAPVALVTQRFGEISIEPSAVFELGTPLPGFEKSRRFALLNLQEFRPFAWFQSMEEPDVCLPVVDPWRYFPEYSPNLALEALASLELEEESELAIYCVVAPHEEGLCLNLAAPLVMHQARGRAEQVILDNSDYGLAVPME